MNRQTMKSKCYQNEMHINITDTSENHVHQRVISIKLDGINVTLSLSDPLN